MLCSKCGLKIDDNDAFCRECGTRIDQAITLNNSGADTDTQKVQKSDYEEVNYDCQDSKNKINWFPKKDSLLPLLVILGVVAIGSTYSIWYMLGKTYIKPTTSYYNVGQTTKTGEASKVQGDMPKMNSTQVTSPTDSSIISGKQSYGEEVGNPTYLTYNDSAYKLSCAYPSHFIKTENIKEEDRFLLESPNKIAKMSICAIQNNSTLSAKAVMQQYINSMGGNIEYQANGDTWYATSITVGDKWYYRKCFVHNDYISWFDFNYPIRYNDMYQSYINYIEDNFKAQQ